LTGQSVADHGFAGREAAPLTLRPTARDRTLIAQRIALAEDLLRQCCFCQHRCRVDRTRGEMGKCGCDATSHAYSEEVLWGEEEFITPSYAIFFAGCNLRCAFCSASESNLQPQNHTPIAAEAVARRVRRCEPRPASFSLIGGEPTVHLHTCLRLIAALPPDLPVVWNSNFYFTHSAAQLLEGLVDVFIADVHFGNDDCARSLAGVESYLETLTRNLQWANSAGTLVARHLVLPGHLECCTRPALELLAEELPRVPIHIMTSYVPPTAPTIGELGRELDEQEAARAFEIGQSLGLRTTE